ncbi:MAG: hypothetical protein ACK4TA_20215 [Saprospiraceae bacterium]
MKLEASSWKLSSSSSELILRSAGLLLVILLITGCKEETETIDNQEDYAYFPLEVGRYWVYEVDSLLVSPTTGGNKIDSTRSYLKDTLVEQFIANNGDTVYRAERYQRRNPGEPWQIAAVFTMSRNQEQAFRTEDNIRLVKLAFPLRRPDGWTSTAYVDPMTTVTVNGNAIAPFNFWEGRARVTDIGEPLTLGSLQFPETVTATYVNRNDIVIAYRFAQEVYAKGVGLVRKDWQILENANPNCDAVCASKPWRQRAERGFLVNQRLIEHN